MSNKERPLWAQMWMIALVCVAAGWILAAFREPLPIVGGIGGLAIVAGIVIAISSLFQYLKSR